MADVLPTHSSISIDTERRNGPHAPLPNPPFVFPLPAESHNEGSHHTQVSSSVGHVGSSRSGSRSRPHQLSLNALPAFDFSPATSSPPHSPSRSPSRRTPPIPHTSGHRRNGSEYVGGDITNGGPMLLSTSPTKSEHSNSHRRSGSESVGGDVTSDSAGLGGPDPIKGEISTHPTLNTRLGPPAVRRGHAHRRSGAISSHDVSVILKPPTESKAGSAPTTPSDPIFQHTPPAELDRSTSQPILSTTVPQTPPAISQQEDTNADAQQRRTRFADKVEFIPRPLSTISSETSSSMSTIRASHSVSDSISSMVSSSTSSSPPNIYHTLRRGQALQDLESSPLKARPRTAEISSRPSSGDWDWDFSGVEMTAKRPSSAPSSDSPSNAVETTGDVCRSESPTSGTRTPNDMSSTPAQTVLSRSRKAQDHLSKRPISPMRPRTSPEPKITKRQRKGRSWGDLLSRKNKHQEFEEMVLRRSPTPPRYQESLEPELSFDDVNFDEDTTYIIDTGAPYTSASSKVSMGYAAWKPRESSPLSESDNTASVLDIDAVLSSSDTSGSGPSFDEVIGGASSSSKRPMHSSGITGGFAGPGMHYHRRAESAPELDPVDHSRFGFPRLGSNPAMAIEEEEEEEDEEVERNNNSHQVNPTTQENQAVEKKEDLKKEEETPGLSVNVVEADPVEDQQSQWVRRRPIKDQTFKQDYREDLNPVEIVGADEEPRFSVITKSSDESTITPTLSPHPMDTLPTSTPAEFTIPTPALTYGTPDTTSATDSSDFTRTSFDGPRVHTANSSITDRTTLSSSRAGDHGLGLHGSVDDVPSLTSSASTMSAHPTRFSSSANSAADRSSSLSAAVPARTRPVSAHKRLSLASLSRLAGSSYNKSKLNIEESAPTETVERNEKKKGKRISRMMKFWKSKEKLSSS